MCGGMTKTTRNEAWITLQTEIRSLHMQLAIFCMEHQSVELEENLRRALGACSECPYTPPKFWALSRRKQGRLDYTALVRYRLRFITPTSRSLKFTTGSFDSPRRIWFGFGERWGTLLLHTMLELTQRRFKAAIPIRNFTPISRRYTFGRILKM